jgi:hypothetical protein
MNTEVKRRRHYRLHVLASITVVLVVGGLVFVLLSGMGTPPTSSNQTSSSLPFLDRVVNVRYYQEQSVAVSEPLSAVISTLQQFNPTYVSTFIALNWNTSLTSQMVSAWDSARAALPNTRFDIMLYANGKGYTSASAVESQINAINSELAPKPDIYFFDFFGQQYSLNPTMWKQVLAYIHSEGQMMSGHVNSAGGDAVPQGIDFVMLATQNFAAPTGVGYYTSQGIPVLVQINNNPQNSPQTESCEFMGVEGAVPSYTRPQRVAYVTTLAQEQSRLGYSFSYPVFFPLCPAGVAYDSVTDGTVGPMVALVRQYN